MDAAAHHGVRLNDRSVGQAAAELLQSQSERRKRGRPPTHGQFGYAGANQPASAAHPEKRHATGGVSAPQPSVNVTVSKKAAAALIKESPTYKRLVETEERIDLAIMRKQQDIKDTLKTHSYTSTRVFRLYIFNTYRSQASQASAVFDDDENSADADESGQGATSSGAENDITDALKDSGDDWTNVDIDGGEDDVAQTPGPSVDCPSWSLRLQGQLLSLAQVPLDPSPGLDADNTCSPVADGASPGAEARASTSLGNGMPSSSTPHLTTFPSQSQLGENNSAKCTNVFRKIVIELDSDVYPESNIVEWNRNEAEPPADGIEISRGGDTECKATVLLYLDHKPERYKLSFVLSRLIGVKTDSRSGVFMAVWQYIKKMKLQCVDDRTSIRMDAGLQTLLSGTTTSAGVIKLQHLFEVIKMHMGPPDPIQIEFDIKLSGNVVDNQACYDIQIELPDDGLRESAASAGIFGLTYPRSAEFLALNDKHMEALEQVAYHKRRRDFLEGFCANPVDFINHVILSQTRDLKVIAGSSGRNAEEERRASFYQQQWVHEAVPRYLLRKAISDTAKKAAGGSGAGVL
jgi:chromatin remodeling complex protein RSC6